MSRVMCQHRYYMDHHSSSINLYAIAARNEQRKGRNNSTARKKSYTHISARTWQPDSTGRSTTSVRPMDGGSLRDGDEHGPPLPPHHEPPPEPAEHEPPVLLHGRGAGGQRLLRRASLRHVRVMLPLPLGQQRVLDLEVLPGAAADGAGDVRPQELLQGAAPAEEAPLLPAAVSLLVPGARGRSVQLVAAAEQPAHQQPQALRLRPDLQRPRSHLSDYLLPPPLSLPLRPG